MLTQIDGTSAQQFAQLAQFAGDDEVWQHGDTRTYFVGDAESEDEEYTLVGTVAEYRQELQALIDAR